MLMTLKWLICLVIQKVGGNMFSFFDTVVDFFDTIWQFFTNIITGLINAIMIVTQATSIPLRLLVYVPSFIFTAISIVLAVGVIKLIVGWGNQ